MYTSAPTNSRAFSAAACRRALRSGLICGSCCRTPACSRAALAAVLNCGGRCTRCRPPSLDDFSAHYFDQLTLISTQPRYLSLLRPQFLLTDMLSFSCDLRCFRWNEPRASMQPALAHGQRDGQYSRVCKVTLPCSSQALAWCLKRLFQLERPTDWAGGGLDQRAFAWQVRRGQAAGQRQTADPARLRGLCI